MPTGGRWIKQERSGRLAGLTGGGSENIVTETNVYNVNETNVDSLNKTPTLDTSCRGCYGKQNGTVVTQGEEMAVDVRNSKESEVSGALQAKASNNLQSNNVVRTNYAVRRLTPLECERLQGLPDNYTLIDDKTCSDSARYKALGNGMAQPCPDFIIRRIVECVGNETD